ncbi:hypothetical protein [Halopiger xanaduensis]|uniref:hypothetical protein n=1 Tax=Halopiger xanaduensis TaxID=387343 RepID=UPI000A857AB5|nr:hypothetical protein [Halopiger xanaduensis]
MSNANDDRSDETSDDEAPGDETSGLGRRRLLRSAVNTGAAVTLVWGLGTANYATSSDLGTITYAMARPHPDADGDATEPRRKDVPVAWQESLRLAFEAQDAIHDMGLAPLVSSFVVPGSYDQPEAAISVEATEENVSDQLEEVAANVPIDINIVDELPPAPERDPEHEQAYQLPELGRDRVPGGVVCESDYGAGTLTPALFDAQSGSRFFATSNHVYGEEGTKETEHRGEPLWLRHDDEPHRVGEVARGYPAADIVQIDPVDGYRPGSVIERASPPAVIGQYTQLGLADLMAQNETLEKVGAISDHTAGEIKGVNAMTCYTGEVCKPGQLVWGDEETLTDGDSGSVNFHPDPENPEEYVLVGGINNARTWWPGSDFTWGTAAHELLDEHGLHF